MSHKAKGMHWVPKFIAAGLCGALAHSLLMFMKSWSGLLPSFQPYESLQSKIGQLLGSDVHPAVPWLLSFVSGATVMGFLFGHMYPFLPGKTALNKGFVFGLLAWLTMCLLFFPLVGLGLFATNIGLGITPAMFSLAMILTYSLVMSLAYDALS